jgi:hypothetical protein
MSMSFQEKSLWVSLAGLVLAFGGSFRSACAAMLPTSAAKDVLPQQAWMFMAATLVLVVVLVAGHLVLALLDRHTEPDERDRSIELKGGKYGALVLATGVFAALCTAVMTEGNAVMAHVLLGSWVLAQGVEVIAKLVMYRRGD